MEAEEKRVNCLSYRGFLHTIPARLLHAAIDELRKAADDAEGMAREIKGNLPAEEPFRVKILRDARYLEEEAHMRRELANSLARLSGYPPEE